MAEYNCVTLSIANDINLNSVIVLCRSVETKSVCHLQLFMVDNEHARTTVTGMGYVNFDHPLVVGING